MMHSMLLPQGGTASGKTSVCTRIMQQLRMELTVCACVSSRLVGMQHFCAAVLPTPGHPSTHDDPLCQLRRTRAGCCMSLRTASTGALLTPQPCAMAAVAAKRILGALQCQPVKLLSRHPSGT